MTRPEQFKQELAQLLRKFDATIECRTDYSHYEGYGALHFYLEGKYTQDFDVIHPYHEEKLPDIVDKNLK